MSVLILVRVPTDDSYTYFEDKGGDRVTIDGSVEVVARFDSDEALHVRCPSGCDLGERDDGNRRWNCEICSGMGFVPVWPMLPSADDVCGIVKEDQ